MALSSRLHGAFERVLYEYCCEEIKSQYQTLDDEPKKRLLEAMMNVFRNRVGSFGNQMSPIPPPTLLCEAAMLLGIPFFAIDFYGLRIALGSWGRNLPEEERIRIHSATLMEMKSDFSKKTFGFYKHFTDDLTSVTRSSDFSKLNKFFIQDLKLFEKSFGKYIEGIIITPPLVMTGITTLLKDARGDIVQLGLYNMVPNCEGKLAIAEKKFPVGLKIKIAQPYYKIFLDGNCGIRVDSPEEVCAVSQTNSTMDEIIEKGQLFTKSKDYLEAFDIYLAGLETFPDLVFLLNNRGQAEVKLEQYELALLDLAAALFIDGGNKKARWRYNKAARKLCCTPEDPTKIYALWKRVLSCNRISSVDKSDRSYTREDGNALYKKGNYSGAKSIYTAVLRGFNNACKLLTGLGFVSLKTEMYQTAVSAASACLQIATDEKHRRQARFIMTTAFSMLGELELANMSAMNDPTMSHLHDQSKESYNVVARALNGFTTPYAVAIANRDILVPSDYTRSDAIEHCYIPGKGRGLKAKRNICKGELLIIDHPVTSQGVNHNETFFLCIDAKRSCTHGAGQIDLDSKLIALIRYDGLLAKKLLLLDAGDAGTADSSESPLPLIPDLEMMAYRKLSHDLLPFLPQTPAEIGIDIGKLTPTFVRSVRLTNIFKWGFSDDERFQGCALALRVSLFNHDKNPNCFHIPVGDSLTIIAIRDIRKGEELTISYGDEMGKKMDSGL